MKPVILEQLADATRRRPRTPEEVNRELLEAADRLWSILQDLDPEDLPDRIDHGEAKLRFAMLECILCAALERAEGATGPLREALEVAHRMILGMAGALPERGEMSSDVLHFMFGALSTHLREAIKALSPAKPPEASTQPAPAVQ